MASGKREKDLTMPGLIRIKEYFLNRRPINNRHLSLTGIKMAIDLKGSMGEEKGDKCNYEIKEKMSLPSTTFAFSLV